MTWRDDWFICYKGLPLSLKLRLWSQRFINRMTGWKPPEWTEEDRKRLHVKVEEELARRREQKGRAK